LFVISVLATSLRFDIALPNGISTRHPNVDQFIDNIRERLSQAIKIYEKTPFGKIIRCI
jgi:hypothetical protein